VRFFKVTRAPKPGEIWKLHWPTDDKDPWGIAPDYTVVITDIKDKWVKYDVIGVSLLRDQTMKLSAFCCCYDYDGASEHG